MKKGRLTEQEKKIIEEMRNDNKSYNEIAEKLNCKKDRIKRYCQTKGLGGFKGGNGNGRGNFDVESFIDNFNKKFEGGLEYVSGYVHSDSSVLVKCLKCGDVTERNAQMARKEKKPICNNCIERKQKALSIKRNAQKELDNLVKELMRKVIEVIETDIINRLNDIELEYQCEECNETFNSKRVRRYCSDSCMNKHNNRNKWLRRRRNVLSNGDMDADISLDLLINRDNNVCHICNTACDKDDYTITKEGYFIAHNNYPSIDHVLSISKGGTHTWDNVKLAHRHCNSIKSDNDYFVSTTKDNL